MEPNGREGGRREARLALVPVSEAREWAADDAGTGNDLVFDFTGEYGLDLTDLALVLTARLQAGPEGRVWVRHIPDETWNVLQALGLDHLFHVYPGPGDAPN